MWLLECDDHNALQGHRMWLRPGGRYVLGRVKNNNDVNVQVESHKSISRTHLIIMVAPVNEEDGLKIHARSKVSVQDNNTKHGTKLNNRNIGGYTVALEGDSHTFILGNYAYLFRLKWTPVIFSFSVTAKERKDKNIMAPYRAKVEAFDIKTIAAWTDITTHAIATKRNTAIGLQALVNGRHIVTSEYLDAISTVTAVPPSENDNVSTISPLEENFDKHWPRPEDYLPPQKSEPIACPPSIYLPNPRRKDLFSGWTFVFCEEVQFQTLLGPITDAQGKAEMFTLEFTKTHPEELIRFVKERERGSNIALVKFRSRNYPEWTSNFVSKVEDMLGLGMIEQNEFLGVILNCDTGMIHRPMPRQKATNRELDVLSVQGTRLRTSNSQSLKSEPDEKLPEPSFDETPVPIPVRNRIRRRVATSVDPFKFDDDEDEDFLPAPTQARGGSLARSQPDLPESLIIHGTQTQQQGHTLASSQLPTPIEAGENQSTSLAQMRVENAPSTYTQKSDKKRIQCSSPSLDQDEVLDVMDLLPGAKIVKRRKIAEESERIREETHRSASASTSSKNQTTTEIKNAEKPLQPKGKCRAENDEDIFAAKAREIREKEEEQAEKKKVEEEHSMDGVNVHALRNLAIVETIEIKPRLNKPIRDAYGNASIHWKQEWNGRNNFKKFRRAGCGGNIPRSVTGAKVFIGLVEHKGRDYGIGDGYWIENEDGGSLAGRGKKQETPQPRVRSLSADLSLNSAARENTEPPSLGSHSTARRVTTRGAATPIQGSVSRQTAPSLGTKRSAAPQAGRAGQEKKRKTLVIQSESDDSSADSDDDGLKFRLRKRR